MAPPAEALSDDVPLVAEPIPVEPDPPAIEAVVATSMVPAVAPITPEVEPDIELTPPPADSAPTAPTQPSPAPAAPTSAPIIGFGPAASSTPPILATDCPACGRPVFAADNFCANCGHRVGSQAVAAASIAARTGATPAPAPAPTPARLPFRPVAAAITGIGLLVFGILFGATVLAPDRTGVRATAAPDAAASPSSVAHQVAVNVSVDETGGTGIDPWTNVAIGEPCPPTDPALGDIGEGTSVVIADQAGTVLAKASLPAGRKSGIGICTYRTRLTVPETPLYAITVADRPATVIPIADLSTAGWTTNLRYAVLP